MPTHQTKQVYLCDDCRSEHATESGAKACEQAHKEGAAFAILCSQYNDLRARVQACCKHPNAKVLFSEEALTMADSRYTEYTKRCPACDKIWKTSAA